MYICITQFCWLNMFIIIIYFQANFHIVQYSIIGDDTARDYFQINSASGLITSKADLRIEARDFYKVCVNNTKEFHYFEH